MAKCTGMRCPMQHGYKVEECNQTDCPYRTEPTTNADRIRAISDEELAKHLIQYRDDWGDYCTPNGEFRDTYEEAKNATIKWLKQPAE